MSLAYVRHAAEGETSREILAQHEAEDAAARGAQSCSATAMRRAHVITDPSTPGGLSKLAAQIEADVIVFCSDSHTAKGSVTVGNSAQRLLNGGTRSRRDRPGRIRAERGFTARAWYRAWPATVVLRRPPRRLSRAFGAELVAAEREAGLMVVGSRPEAEEGVSRSAPPART